MSIQHALLALSVTSALNYGVDARTESNLARTVTKTSAIAILAALSFSIDAPRRLVAALAFCALGDAVIAWDDGDQAFLCGLGSFLIGHLFYAVLFANQTDGKQFDVGTSLAILADEPWRGILVIILVAISIGMILVLVPRISRDLRVPIGVYTTVIAVMVTLALTLEDARIVAGALMFALSDSLLAMERFLLSSTSVHRSWIEYAIWGLYYGGQLSIMLGVTEFPVFWWK